MLWPHLAPLAFANRARKSLHARREVKACSDGRRKLRAEAGVLASLRQIRTKIVIAMQTEYAIKKRSLDFTPTEQKTDPKKYWVPCCRSAAVPTFGPRALGS